MKRLIPLLSALILLSSFLPSEAQVLIKNSSVTGVCYAGTKVNRIYIPPPEAFFRRGKSGGAIITVNYTGFTAQAKTAVDYAVRILENLLPADAKITLDASWVRISTSGVLAQSTITGYAGGAGINAINPLSFYPIALAEKISGKAINSDQDGDITLEVNSSINWYLGTDGHTPVQKYDLVTVALHEICHGLGFFDSFSSDGTVGSYGIGSFPLIYDTFVENFSGSRLTDTLKFPNNSNDLRSQLISGQVYFNGPLLKRFTTLSNYSVLRAKLYSPATWDAGSSISHLDEATTLGINSLMTPFIDLGEAIHDPGKYTLSILGDIGWINTRVIHTPMGDSESHLTNIQLSADIKSDTTYDHSRVGVVYSFDNFTTSDTVYMSSPGTNNSYTISLPVPGYNSQLQYYFLVQDNFQRTYRSPSAYKDFHLLKNNRYHVYIGTDTIKPRITHTPVAYYLQKIDSLKFQANITDNLGIDSAYIELRINNGPSRFIRMNKGISDSYLSKLDARTLILKGHDSIRYKIFAVDTARVPNLRVTPASGYFVTPVEEISNTVSEYSTDFSTTAADFFNIGFDVTKPAGFNKFGLNSKHPYTSPLDNSKTIDNIAILRHPLKFNESGMLFSYNEVVLVEPGAQGSVFGSPDFFDYVIIEGSKNFGKTWFNLIDGYDSRLYSTWETDYNSSISGDNSTFAGTEALLKKHTFLYRPSDKISAGDSMLVRFRLFSDPFANGWGWVVEDLNINPLVDAVPELTTRALSIYPNPGEGIFKIDASGSDLQNSKPVRYRIFNSSGICIKDATMSGSGETLIDISNYPSGIYIILMYFNDHIERVKYSLSK